MMQPLTGSFVALITPMFPDGTIDYDSLKSLIDWHVRSGTSGIVAVGTTGESATLLIEEHIKVIENTVNYVNGRIPVIAGSGSNSTAQAIETTIESKKVGADYALLVTPYYNKPTQKGLIEHYLKIADTVDIPQILYNVPSRTACDLKSETVSRLSEHPNIIGIKEAFADSSRLNQLYSLAEKIKHQKKFYVFSGDDLTFNSHMSNGGDGVISVAANILPAEISEICSLNLNNKFSEAEKLNKKFSLFYELLFIESNPIPVKWMLERMSKVKSGIRLPLVSLSKNYHERVLNEMMNLKLL